jgi:hypothetical protein
VTLQTQTDISPDGNRTNRRVEMGFLKKPTTMIFVLYFEDLPLWLLSLDRFFVSRVYIFGFESSSELLQYLDSKTLDLFLINKAAARLGFGRIKYLGLRSPPKETVKLVSGKSPLF